MVIKEEVLFKYLEIVLDESEISKPNSSMNILHEKHLNPITDEEREEYFSITDGIVKLGIKLGYFQYISKESDWFELTEKGILVKSKGGHYQYLEYLEKRELEKIKPTIITQNYIGGDNHGIQSINNFSDKSRNTHFSPNKSNELKQTSKILSFWKLISENKLISGLLLIIILWAIKELFGITLKI